MHVRVSCCPSSYMVFMSSAGSGDSPGHNIRMGMHVSRTPSFILLSLVVPATTMRTRDMPSAHSARCSPPPSSDKKYRKGGDKEGWSASGAEDYWSSTKGDPWKGYEHKPEEGHGQPIKFSSGVRKPHPRMNTPPPAARGSSSTGSGHHGGSSGHQPGGWYHKKMVKTVAEILGAV